MIAPSRVALRGPVIVIVWRSSGIYHEIHHRAAPDRSTSWQIATAVFHRQAVTTCPIQISGPRFTFVQADVVSDVQSRSKQWHVREEYLVFALLEQQHVPLRVFRQSIRQKRAR